MVYHLPRIRDISKDRYAIILSPNTLPISSIVGQADFCLHIQHKERKEAGAFVNE